MAAKELVISRFPDSAAECQKTGEWSVWDMPVSMTHGVRWNGDAAVGRCLWGLGVAEEIAWADAVREIEKAEGRRLTANNI